MAYLLGAGGGGRAALALGADELEFRGDDVDGFQNWCGFTLFCKQLYFDLHVLSDHCTERA